MESVKRGRRIVIGIIVVILLIDIITIAITTSIFAVSGRMEYASFKLLQGIFRFILEGVILFFLYKGHKWAKWIIIILLVIAGILSLVSVPNFILLALGIVYLGISVTLIFSRSTKDFFCYQKEGLNDSDTTLKINNNE